MKLDDDDRAVLIVVALMMIFWPTIALVGWLAR